VWWWLVFDVVNPEGAMPDNHRISALRIIELGFVMLLGFSANAQNTVSGHAAAISVLDSNKEQDGLLGSVRRVQIESAKFEAKSGQLTEGPRQLLEVTTYDLKGARIDNSSYLVPTSPVGKEDYKYDEKGNIIEMTLRGDDGSIISRETYKYEFDRIGNWTKMVTSLVIFEAGELKSEPVEATYRTITYYFDQAIAKIVDTHASLAAPGVSAPHVSPKARLVEQLPPRTTRADLPASSLETIAGSPSAPSQPLEVGTSEPRYHIGTEPSPAPAESEARAAEVATDSRPRSETPSETTSHRAAFQFYKSGRQRFDQGNLVGAVEAYQQSLQLEPGGAELYLSLGHAYLKLNKSSEAIKAFNESIRLNPEKEEAHYGLGVEYLRTNKNRDAAEAFKRAIRLRPKLAKAHYGLALAYQEMQRKDLLVEEYRILESLDPALAKKLESTYPQLHWPCRVPPFCQ